MSAANENEKAAKALITKWNLMIDSFSTAEVLSSRRGETMKQKINNIQLSLGAVINSVSFFLWNPSFGVGKEFHQRSRHVVLFNGSSLWNSLAESFFLFVVVGWGLFGSSQRACQYGSRHELASATPEF
jgi:hypothetical protein